MVQYSSKRLWYCLSQYGEITSCRYLTRTLVTSLPGLPGLTSLNIAHVATDQLVLTISRHLVQLVSLDMSNSSVTDKAVKFLAGAVLHILYHTQYQYTHHAIHYRHWVHHTSYKTSSKQLCDQESDRDAG